MRKLLFAIPLFYCALAHATISQPPTAHVCAAQDTPTTRSVTVTATIPLGNTVLVAVSTNSSTAAISGITDDGGSLYSELYPAFSGTGSQLHVWATPLSGAHAATQVTVSISANSKFVACVLSYSGVTGFGQNPTTGSFASTSQTANIVTQDNNNVAVALFGFNNIDICTGTVGTLEGQAQTTTSSAAALCVSDNLGTTAGTVSNTITIPVSRSVSKMAIELRSQITIPISAAPQRRVTSD